MGGLGSGRYPKGSTKANANLRVGAAKKAKKTVVKAKAKKKVTPKLKANRVIVDLIIADNSGSMQGRRATEARNGINNHFTSLRETAKSTGLVVKCAVNLFSNSMDTLRPLQTVDSIAEVTVAQYNGHGGSTALNDAICKGIGDLERIFGTKKNSALDLSIIVFTDGEENASREFRPADVHAAIKRAESYGWRVVFMGEGLASSYGTAVGIDASNNLSYTNTADAMTQMSAGRAKMSQTYASRGVSEQVGFFAQYSDNQKLK